MLRDKCLSSSPQWSIYQPRHVPMSRVLQQLLPPSLSPVVLLPVPLPTSQNVQVLPHQSLEFSWQRGKWGRRGWLGSGIIIQIPPSEAKRWGREIMASLCGGEGRREGGGSLTLGLKLFSERLMVLGGSSQRVRPASWRKEKPPFRLDLCTLGSQPVYSVPLHWAHLSPATPRLGRSHEPCFEGEVQRSWRDTHGTSLCRLLHFLLWSSLPAPLNQGIYQRWTQEHAFSQSSPGSADAAEAVLANDCSEAQQDAMQASVFL